MVSRVWAWRTYVGVVSVCGWGLGHMALYWPSFMGMIPLLSSSLMKHTIFVENYQHKEDACTQCDAHKKTGGMNWVKKIGICKNEFGLQYYAVIYVCDRAVIE